MNQNLAKLEPTIIMLGTFDSKGKEFEFLYTCLKDLGSQVITINTGIRQTDVNFPIDKSSEDVAIAVNTSLADLRKIDMRSEILDIMAMGAQNIIVALENEKRIDGVIGMGGGGGTYLALKSMRNLSMDIAKVCISTVASKDLSRQMGTQNVMLMPSIVDIAGLNRISRLLLKQAAGAIVGMSKVVSVDHSAQQKTIAISIFGNTTECANHCSVILKNLGYEVLCFHAVGSGGRTMEALISKGLIDGVLDITTTELADELCAGICTAGPKRLEAAGDVGIPQVVVPGCLDMVNFAHEDSVPMHYSDRLFHKWSPDVTLMRTNKKENEQLGRIIADKLNRSKGKVAILLPMKGISIVSSEGNIFHDPTTDQLLFKTIKDLVRNDILVKEVDENINAKKFAEEAVNTLLDML